MKFIESIKHFYDALSEPVKTTFDALSVGTILATFLNLLPHIAAGLSVVWGVMRIYEQHLKIKKLKENHGNE